MAIGAVVTAVTCLLAFAAVVFVSVWGSGGGPVAAFGWTIQVGNGWQGLWTVAACVGCLVLAGYVTAGGAAACGCLPRPSWAIGPPSGWRPWRNA
ncbi:hypothetical protein AB0P36_22185 [Streptomyces flavidovirens]|uniref:hypothetical protein n=1 Tax=Streptomyces flavidovirens TaxID=67298 RepID=UPI003419867F